CLRSGIKTASRNTISTITNEISGESNELIETCDSRRRRILGKAVIAVKQNGVDPGRHCPFDVFPHTVADVPGLARFNRVKIQSRLKNRRVRLGHADTSRDVNRIEEAINPASLQRVIQPRIKVGNNAQLQLPVSQLHQRLRDIVVNAPELATAEPLENFAEEFFEARKRAEAGEDRLHKIAPPAFLKLAQRCVGRTGGKGERRLAPK